MKCVVVGNSPNFDNYGLKIDSYDLVIRVGAPILSDDTGYNTDVLITRANRIHELNKVYRSAFNYTYAINEQSDKPCPGQIIVLSMSEARTDQLLTYCDQVMSLSSNEKPTLGSLAVAYAIQCEYTVTIVGIETDFTSQYISKGHYGDLKHVRNNVHHNIYKEMLWLNKLKRRDIIKCIDK